MKHIEKDKVTEWVEVGVNLLTFLNKLKILI